MSVVYIQLKKREQLMNIKHIRLKHIANIMTQRPGVDQLQQLIVYEVAENSPEKIVLQSKTIIERITKEYPDVKIHWIGEPYAVVQVKKTKNYIPNFLVPVVWLLLFIGSGMTIMNFHHDVGMQEVQQKLHYILTGDKNEYPLWMQIPYSFGLGIGMLLFFNHWFSKRFTKEPSPLELELFKYDEAIDQYEAYKKD